MYQHLMERTVSCALCTYILAEGKRVRSAFSWHERTARAVVYSSEETGARLLGDMEQRCGCLSIESMRSFYGANIVHSLRTLHDSLL